MTFGKTILWSALSVVGPISSATLAPVQAVPVVPNFTQRLNDEPHRDNLKSDRDDKFDGLFHRISILSDWIRRYSVWSIIPGTGSNNVTIRRSDFIMDRNVTSKPQFTQTTPGAAFQYTETY